MLSSLLRADEGDNMWVWLSSLLRADEGAILPPSGGEGGSGFVRDFLGSGFIPPISTTPIGRRRRSGDPDPLQIHGLSRHGDAEIELGFFLQQCAKCEHAKTLLAHSVYGGGRPRRSADRRAFSPGDDLGES